MTLLIIIIAIVALAGFPLFLTISGLSFLGFSSENLSLSLYFAELMRLASNPTLSAIPLFTLSGYILASSSAPERLVRLAKVLIGWMPGGMAIVAIIVMAMLTAFTGASGITIVALGGLMLPTLLKGGFKERFSLGLITSSGSVGLLFPPSLPLILYGVVSETPIDKLFIAGIVPGFLLIGGMSLFSIYKGRQITVKTNETGDSLLYALKNAIWEALLPVIVIGGIYSGLITVNEAAVATVVYLLIVELIIYRDIKPKDLPHIFSQSATLVGGILVILGAALALTNYLVYADIPMILLDWIQTKISSRWAFLLSLNLFLLAVGCLMDVFSALVIIIPLILPLAKAYGIDPLHLGIIFLANLEIGYSTPPVGLNLFIASFRFEKPIIKLYLATLPFLIIQFIVLIIITYFPLITLYPVGLFK